MTPIAREFVPSGIERRAVSSEISPHSAFVRPIGIAEFAFKIGLFASHDEQVHDNPDWDQEEQAPPSIEQQTETNVDHRQPDIEWIASKSKRSGVDNRRRRLSRIDVRAVLDHRRTSGRDHCNSDQNSNRPHPSPLVVVKYQERVSSIVN